jgi:hypothetical protein
VGPCFFEGTVTGAEYLNMFEVSTVPTIHQLYGDVEIYCQQDVASSHYHHDARTCLDNNYRNRWIGRRGSGKYPHIRLI